MAVTVREVIAALENIAPPHLACAKDPIGLQAGDPRWRVSRLLLCLDVTPAAVQEARRLGCEMLVSHHPLFYHPLPHLAETSARGWLTAEIGRSRLAVYCAHTNLDNAEGGINDTLAALAGLKRTAPLTVEAHDRLLKLSVFVPDSHLQAVRQAIGAAGAGQIGEYSDCSFRVRGIGTFRGSAAAQPYIGKAGQLEEVEEWRLEALLRESQRPAVEAALREAHPYEEPAYDFYSLADSRAVGLGRVGELAQATTLRQ
ncbi:MAG: Nif3-like dinuclear metal center hexameric protein, partial [Planctomycetota bacterium]|nr:Nif3-like dinuclear metal center hexameric protein [Planctomycetota bacterium]